MSDSGLPPRLREFIESTPWVFAKTWPHEYMVRVIESMPLCDDKLKGSGIPAYVRRDDCGGMRPWLRLATGGLRLAVRDVDAQGAAVIEGGWESLDQRAGGDTGRKSYVRPVVGTAALPDRGRRVL